MVLENMTSKFKDISHYIISSSNGWPEYKVGFLGSYDFTIQNDEPKLYEFNTNIACLYDAPMSFKIKTLTNYFSSQNIDKLHVFGLEYNENVSNPSKAFYEKLSKCCLNLNISSSLILDSVHNTHWNIPTGSDEYTLFIQTPYQYNELDSLVSGSYSKRNFKSILSNSPSSSMKIHEFNPKFLRGDDKYPDYIVKNSEKDRSLLSGNLKLYSYNESHYKKLSQSLSDDYILEEYVIGSGSSPNDNHIYNYEYTNSFLFSYDNVIDLGIESLSHRLTRKDSYGWDLVPSLEYRHIVHQDVHLELSDGSYKKVSELLIGDSIKSVELNGLRTQSNDLAKWKSKDINGDVKNSKITNILHKKIPSYYLINQTHKLPNCYGRVVEKKELFKLNIPSELDLNSKLISKTSDNNFSLTEIKSIEFVLKDDIFYSIELEGADLFYINDLLVHS